MLIMFRIIQGVAGALLLPFDAGLPARAVFPPYETPEKGRRHPGRHLRAGDLGGGRPDRRRPARPECLLAVDLPAQPAARRDRARRGVGCRSASPGTSRAAAAWIRSACCCCSPASLFALAWGPDQEPESRLGSGLHAGPSWPPALVLHHRLRAVGTAGHGAAAAARPVSLESHSRPVSRSSSWACSRCSACSFS